MNFRPEFSSLYPSVLLRFNPEPIIQDSNDQNEVTVSCDVGTSKDENHDSDDKSTLPKVLNELLEERLKLKEKLKTENDQEVIEKINLRLLSYRICINSLYGYTSK